MLERRYEVTERDGNLYLTLDGVAFSHIGQGMTAQQIVSELNEARNASLLFANLMP